MEAVLGAQLEHSALDEAVLLHLVATGAPETEQVEFKRDSYPKAAPGSPKLDFTKEQEFAKDVCALANHRGGVLILGLEEQQGKAHMIVPLADPTFEKAEQRLRQALSNHMAPLGVVEMIGIPLAASGFAMMVIVPPSSRSPHAVLTKIGIDQRQAPSLSSQAWHRYSLAHRI